MTVEERIARQVHLTNIIRKRNAELNAAQAGNQGNEDRPETSALDRIRRQREATDRMRQVNRSMSSVAPEGNTDDRGDVERRTAERIAKQRAAVSVATSIGTANSTADEKMAELMNEYRAFAANLRKMIAEDAEKKTAAEPKPAETIAEEVKPVAAVEDAPVNGISTEEGSVILTKVRRARKKVSEVTASVDEA